VAASSRAYARSIAMSVSLARKGAATKGSKAAARAHAKGFDGMLDVTIVLLEGGYASTAILVCPHGAADQPECRLVSALQ